MSVNNDLEELIENLPFFLQEYLTQHNCKEQLIEIILDLGRRPQVRFLTGPEYLSQKIISWQDIDYIIKRINKFSNENRAGIERTLHRISCISKSSIFNKWINLSYWSSFIWCYFCNSRFIRIRKINTNIRKTRCW